MMVHFFGRFIGSSFVYPSKLSCDFGTEAPECIESRPSLLDGLFFLHYFGFNKFMSASDTTRTLWLLPCFVNNFSKASAMFL